MRSIQLWGCGLRKSGEVLNRQPMGQQPLRGCTCTCVKELFTVMNGLVSTRNAHALFGGVLCHIGYTCSHYMKS
jgi:hypothetical protein